jgi:hypothetical protein
MLSGCVAKNYQNPKRAPQAFMQEILEVSHDEESDPPCGKKKLAGIFVQIRQLDASPELNANSGTQGTQD